MPAISRRAASSVAGLEPVTITVAPSSLNRRALAAPMPVRPVLVVLVGNRDHKTWAAQSFPGDNADQVV